MISAASALPIAVSFAGVAAPAVAVISVDPLWTPIVRVAVAIELVWIGGGLALLWWLTRRSTAMRSTRPKAPEKLTARNEPPLAA